MLCEAVSDKQDDTMCSSDAVSDGQGDPMCYYEAVSDKQDDTMRSCGAVSDGQCDPMCYCEAVSDGQSHTWTNHIEAIHNTPNITDIVFLQRSLISMVKWIPFCGMILIRSFIYIDFHVSCVCDSV